MSQPTPTPSDLKSRLKSSYDAVAPAYNAWTSISNTLRLTYLNHALDLLPSSPPSTPLSALELGCGAGTPVCSTLLSSPRGLPFHVIGNDLSTTQVSLAKQNLGEDEEKVRWIEGDMTKLEFPEGSFDLIIALYSIIHLPREEQVEMMGKVVKWLKKGGVVLVNFGAEESEGNEMDGWMGEGGWMYWSGLGAEGSLDAVKKVGLEVVKGEVSDGDGVDANFLWVVGRKV